MTDQSLWRLEGCRVWQCLGCRRVGVGEAYTAFSHCFHCEEEASSSSHMLEVFVVPAWVARILSYEFAEERSKEAKEIRTMNP